ncbi:uncharacterized protein [Brachionichthys hirsutus]|uniref:uncharacterized protein n=1 Tax=Brachionichthys hirsutus TaxID=412623 RepID=UPI0036053397
MPETAESHAVILTTNRNCVIEIHNVSQYYLYNPQVYTNSGYAHSPPTPTLRPNFTEVCSFTKDDNTASGAVGVLTYEVVGEKKRYILGVMFSVPFDRNFYSNWLGVGIFDSPAACDEALYKKMYNDKEESFVRHKADGSGITFSNKKLKVRACMSDEGRAIIKMEVYDN